MISEEKVTRDWLDAQFPAARVVTETPADLEANLPVIKVQGLGGPRKLVLGRAAVDVECYAATKDAARDLAGDVSDALTYRMHGLVGGSVVTHVQGAMPDWRPYDNPNVRRYGAIYRIYLKDLQPA